MSTSTVMAFFVIILAVIIADIFCGNVQGNTNAWTNLGNNNQNSTLNAPGWVQTSKSTTPWPELGRGRANGNQRVNTNQQQWVRQSNIWVRNNNNPQTSSVRPQTGPIMGLNMGQSNRNPTMSNMGRNPVLGNNQRGSNPTGFTNTNGGTVSNQNRGNIEVNDDELRAFSEELLNKDVNNAARHVTINYQGMTTSRSSNDEAPMPLLTISQGAYSIPTIEKLMLLYNNYILEANQNEVYTAQEKIEENNLLDTVLSTPVMQHTRNFLINKGKLGKDPKELKDLLRSIWFNMYSRGEGRIGSSGFEHVFIAEIKKNTVSGLHNWLYFNEEETKNRANYLGYMKKINLGEKGAIIKYHFTLHGLDKPVGSMFIGTSPELEMALYSTCFILRADRICPLKMEGKRFIIRTYTYRYRGKNLIGSAFPEI